MVEINRMISELKRVATRLTSDTELRRDLVQEMYVHFMSQVAEDQEHSLTWYVKGCEFHGRNYLRRGRSVDSLKRARGQVLLRVEPGVREESSPTDLVESESMTTDGTMYSEDVLAQLDPYLSARQKVILERLMRGYGVRQVARELGISHVAVIKHRRKIAKIAAEIMQVSQDGRFIAADHGEMADMSANCA
jgi:DNA-directed RNA polymerase specialized sigma24 family protein